MADRAQSHVFARSGKLALWPQPLRLGLRSVRPPNLRKVRKLLNSGALNQRFASRINDFSVVGFCAGAVPNHHHGTTMHNALSAGPMVIFRPQSKLMKSCSMPSAKMTAPSFIRELIESPLPSTLPERNCVPVSILISQ